MRDSVGAVTRVERQPETARVGGLLAPLDRASSWGLVGGLIPFAVAFAVYLVVFLESRPDATGDEPHYFITAQSIAYDFDLDLTNDYTAERVRRVTNVFPIDAHAFVFKESGELRPFRGVGLPAVLAPAVGLGGLTGARLVMVLIAALLADQLYRLLRDLRLRRPYRVLAWVAALFCLPVVVFSSQLYPELAGALLVVAALRVIVVGASRPAALALASSAAAALVWLHVRYFPLSVGILIGLFLAACVHDWSPGAHGRGLTATVQAARALVVRSAVVLATRWRTVTLPVLAPYVVGLGSLAAAFEYWYGSPNLQVAYGAYGSQAVGTGQWDFWYQYALRDILDPVVGWIPFAPVHWLGFAALGCLVVVFGWPAAGCIAVAAGYELVISSVGTGVGFGLPARYPMILVPLIAIPLAVAIQGLRVARFVFVPLLACSMIFAVAAVRDFTRLYPSEAQGILGMRSTAPAFPKLAGVSVPELSVSPPQSFYFGPDAQPAPQTGKLEGGEVVARAGRHKPGFLRFGPYVRLKRGAYLATFSLAAEGVSPNELVAMIQVVGGATVFANRPLTGRQLPSLPNLNTIELSFATPGGVPVETRVYYRGKGTLRAGPISVQSIAPPQAEVHFHHWPLAFLWVAGTFLIGWLFVQVMRLSRQRKTNERHSEHSAGA